MFIDLTNNTLINYIRCTGDLLITTTYLVSLSDNIFCWYL